jgi:hypothetical protein
MKPSGKYEDLMAPWKTSTVRESLIQRIKHAAAFTANSQTLFTEEKIAEEYYRSYLELPPTALLQRIAQHPLLTKKQRVIIDAQLA